MTTPTQAEPTNWEDVDLPMKVVMAIGYLNGVMDEELTEIRQQWEIVREYLCSKSISKATGAPS